MPAGPSPKSSYYCSLPTYYPPMPLPDYFLADLQAQNLLPPEQAAAIGADERSRPFSLHYELRALLYLGILLLSGGLGVLVYQNIDSIGHGVVVAAVAALTAACFAYANRYRAPFTWGVAPQTSVGANYLLLLGCLLFLVLEGYLQVQYHLFGTRYGLAALVPAAVFFAVAYLFDHRGVLSMAVTALASWVGVSVAPLDVLRNADFFGAALGNAGIGLGVALMAAGWLSEYFDRKRHFAYTYLALGSNLALLAASVRIFAGTELQGAAVALFVLGLCAGLAWYARRTQSYLFMVLAAFYGYGALTYLAFLLSSALPEGFLFLAGTAYFPLTALGVVLFFVNLKKLLRLPQ